MRGSTLIILGLFSKLLHKDEHLDLLPPPPPFPRVKDLEQKAAKTTRKRTLQQKSEAEIKQIAEKIKIEHEPPAPHLEHKEFHFEHTLKGLFKSKRIGLKVPQPSQDKKQDPSKAAREREQKKIEREQIKLEKEKAKRREQEQKEAQALRAIEQEHKKLLEDEREKEHLKAVELHKHQHKYDVTAPLFNQLEDHETITEKFKHFLQSFLARHESSKEITTEVPEYDPLNVPQYSQGIEDTSPSKEPSIPKKVSLGSLDKKSARQQDPLSGIPTFDEIDIDVELEEEPAPQKTELKELINVIDDMDIDIESSARKVRSQAAKEPPLKELINVVDDMDIDVEFKDEPRKAELQKLVKVIEGMEIELDRIEKKQELPVKESYHVPTESALSELMPGEMDRSEHLDEVSVQTRLVQQQKPAPEASADIDEHAIEDAITHVKEETRKQATSAGQDEPAVEQPDDMPRYSQANPVDEIEHLIKGARKALMNFDFFEAKRLYIEIMKLYNSMSTTQQHTVYQDLTELYHERKNAERYNTN